MKYIMKKRRTNKHKVKKHKMAKIIDLSMTPKELFQLCLDEINDMSYSIAFIQKNRPTHEMELYKRCGVEYQDYKLSRSELWKEGKKIYAYELSQLEC